MAKSTSQEVTIPQSVLEHPLLRETEDIGIYVALLAYPDMSQRVLARRLKITRAKLRQRLAKFIEVGLIQSEIKDGVSAALAATRPGAGYPVIDWDAFKDFFNKKVKGSRIPRIIKLNNRRKSAVLARSKTYGKDALAAVIKNCISSAFLNGDNTTGFIADFDWIFRPCNFLKILEGKYADRAIVINNNNGNTTSNLSKSASEARQREFSEHLATKLGAIADAGEDVY